eukprot:4974488-Amphidinium_carterae.1
MEVIGVRKQQCQDLAVQIARELESTKHTGWWCNGEVISEKSPWEVVMEGQVTSTTLETASASGPDWVFADWGSRRPPHHAKARKFKQCFEQLPEIVKEAWRKAEHLKVSKRDAKTAIVCKKGKRTTTPPQKMKPFVNFKAIAL